MTTFAVISDPHVAVANPQTGWAIGSIPQEPTLYDRSVELLEAAIAEINALENLDFVVVAGDLTKDSEPYNHDAARQLLTRFRKPVFCVPGNHDQPRPPKLRPLALLDPDVEAVETRDIPRLYGDFGFRHTELTAWAADPTPDIHLVGLCSAKPEDDCGYISPELLAWLDDDLSRQRDAARETIVMLHHSIIEHVPGERVNPMFSWFHVENSEALKAVLHRHGVRLTLTGHLHIQDVKCEDGLYNIVTASLAGYPHAYRICELRDGELEVRSRRLTSIPSAPDLQGFSRRNTADAFVTVIRDVLCVAPFNYELDRAEVTAEKLRDWWPRIADGDEAFLYAEEELGDGALAAYVNSFNDEPPSDNDLTIELPPRV